MLGGKHFEFSDNGFGSSACDFGFRAGDTDQHIVFCQRGGERLYERKVA